MKVGFAHRISFVLAIVLVAGAVMTGVLNVYKFERTLANLLTSRFLFVVNDIRQKIETQMDLGLPLIDLQNVSEELHAYLLIDQQIMSIEVFDETGNVLFSTDPSFVGDLVSENWILLWRANRGNVMWSTLESDAGVVGIPLRNNLNQDVGSLALRYSRTFLDRSVTEQIEKLLLLGLAVVFAMILLTFIGCTILLRRSIEDLRNMGTAMNDITKREKDSVAIQEAQSRHPEFAKFTESALSAHGALDQATIEIRRLDEEST